MTGPRFLHSTLFRLALLYGVFFCFSVSVLLSFVYFSIVREMEDQIKHSITLQMNSVLTSYKNYGMEGVKRQISEFLEEEDEGLGIALLVDAKGKTVAGNLESWPEEVEFSGKWLLFYIESTRRDSDDVNILARDTTLSNGSKVLLGYSLRGPSRTRQMVLDAMSFSVALALAFTLIGSAFFSSIIKKRLEKVNVICKQVMEGNLDASVPTTGGADEFDQLSDNVNHMLRRITELVKGLQQTSDNIAHDLRTPLNRHRIRLEGMMSQTPDPDHWRQQLKSGMEEVDSIVETLNSILRISQAQSGVASEHFSQFDLAASVSDVLDFYTDLAEQRHIEIYQEIPQTMLVMGDKPMLTQAIANLVDNAIKYTPRGGRVEVRLTAHDRVMELRVSDNGTGIPEAFREKVKERFFRMEASRTSPGTGLGLSLADAVARLHRGTLELQDNSPGLLVVVSLPIVV